MPCRSRIAVDLIVIPAFERLVAEKMNGRVIDSAASFLRCQILQAIRLVPASGKHVEGYLSTY